MYLTKWPLSVYTYKFFICTQYIYEDYIITMNEMQCLITVLLSSVHVCVTSDVMCVLCFRAWTQYWVVIHHYTTRSSIQGGSIRNLLLTLSQYFSSLYFANCDANRMPCQCAGVNGFSLGFLLGFLGFNVWCVVIIQYLHSVSCLANTRQHHIWVKSSLVMILFFDSL